MATRRRRGEDGISFEHRGPCRDPERHRHCPGLWRGEITVGYTGDGKRTRRKVSGQTKAAVIDKLRDLHTQLDKGITPKAGYVHYTVRQAADDLQDGLEDVLVLGYGFGGAAVQAVGEPVLGGLADGVVDVAGFGGDALVELVPLEYSIEQLTCAVASRLDAGMVG